VAATLVGEMVADDRGDWVRQLLASLIGPSDDGSGAHGVARLLSGLVHTGKADRAAGVCLAM